MPQHVLAEERLGSPPGLQSVEWPGNPATIDIVGESRRRVNRSIQEKFAAAIEDARMGVPGEDHRSTDPLRKGALRTSLAFV